MSGSPPPAARDCPRPVACQSPTQSEEFFAGVAKAQLAIGQRFIAKSAALVQRRQQGQPDPDLGRRRDQRLRHRVAGRVALAAGLVMHVMELATRV
jgi:hypothetical protein